MVQRMHFACWITQATDTHSDYVILFAFQGNSTYTNAHQCYIIHRFSVMCVVFFSPSRQCLDITSKLPMPKSFHVHYNVLLTIVLPFSSVRLI